MITLVLIVEGLNTGYGPGILCGELGDGNRFVASAGLDRGLGRLWGLGRGLGLSYGVAVCEREWLDLLEGGL